MDSTTLTPEQVNQLLAQAAAAQSPDYLKIFLITVGLILLFLYIVYVLLIMKKNKVKEALASIDVQLKKRYDLIPNILFWQTNLWSMKEGC